MARSLVGLGLRAGGAIACLALFALAASPAQARQEFVLQFGETGTQGGQFQSVGKIALGNGSL